MSYLDYDEADGLEEFEYNDGMPKLFLVRLIGKRGTRLHITVAITADDAMQLAVQHDPKYTIVDSTIIEHTLDIGHKEEIQ